MKNIMITTGGTGGHVVPATILYQHLKNFNIFISTDERGARFLDKKKYNIKIINVKKISKNIFLFPIQIFSFLSSILKSFIFLKRKKIEILISTGGYMSLPVCIAAKIANVRFFLFEPNMVLGRSNKLFLNSCEKIFCYSDKIKNFPKKLGHKVCLIPTLLRKEFYSFKNEKDLEHNINLLIIGGSQGAKLFDTIINKAVVKISKKYELKIFQQTSSKNYEYFKDFYFKNNIKNELFDFNENILNFMNKSNICITRAGASTLAELVYLNIPHIAIPLPTARDNHQYENAIFYQEYGCNWIMEQKEINEKSFMDKIVSIIKNKEEYLNKKRNMKNFNLKNTWNYINQKIIETINEN